MAEPTWTEEQFAEGERLWATGLKAKDVAAAIGVTRNAFLGMAHRKRWLRGAPEETRPGPKPKPPTKKAPPMRRSPKSIRRDPPPEPKRPKGGVTLLMLDEPFPARHCRWPVSGSGAAMLFCGQVPADGAAVYCAEHRTKAAGVSYGHGRMRLP